MSHTSPLLETIQQAISRRLQDGMTIIDFDDLLPSSAPDFFSNDYLSISTDPVLRDNFLRQVLGAPRLFGSTGSRIATGNSAEYNQVEKRFERFFQAPSALLFGSGFSANLAFLATVPQKNDVVIYDELMHSSCREGFRLSSARGAVYSFSHNSVSSFDECLRNVLNKHPQISRGTSTVFVVVESLYSMDGDFCPLPEIVELMEALVPVGHSHIVVDEAHTSGICGPNGTGYVSMLGLNDRVHTKVHTFGKAWGFHGAVVLTSPIIRSYLINFAKSVIFSTSITFADIYALHACLDVISSENGDQARDKLRRICRYAHRRLKEAFKATRADLLALNEESSVTELENYSFYSPIIPIFSSRAADLTRYLVGKGYAPRAVTFPAVDRARIRVIIHALNTEADVDALIGELVVWAEGQSGGGSPSAGLPADVQTSGVRARL